MPRLQSNQNINHHVLVIDDEEMIRDILCRFVSNLGHTVMAVEEGSGAVKEYEKSVLKGHKYDVAIVDLNLECGMNGVETIKRLKEIDPAIEAVVTSGYPEEPVLTEYKNYGFSGVLSKPFTIEDLENVLSKYS